MNIKKSIGELIMEYFKKHPRKDLEHGPVVDWVEKEYLKTHKNRPRDIWRNIRSLYEEGILIKIKDGVYHYDPDFVSEKKLENFTAEQKDEIFKRDEYRCVQCGRRQDEGLTLHADHRVPKSKGGKATVDNGQTLCSICNFRKKNYNQTESGKKMLIMLWKTAKKIGDGKTMKFCEEVLSVYEKFDINGHIVWKK